MTQNLEVQALMEEFAKLVGPSSDIYRSEKMKLGLFYFVFSFLCFLLFAFVILYFVCHSFDKIEQSLLEIQKLKVSLLEETRRIQEKDALIEKKLEASLQGQDRERKHTETLVCLKEQKNIKYKQNVYSIY